LNVKPFEYFFEGHILDARTVWTELPVRGEAFEGGSRTVGAGLLVGLLVCAKEN
jgi:hypothetical protein